MDSASTPTKTSIIREPRCGRVRSASAISHTHTNTPTRHEGWCIAYVPGATWRENSRKLATTTAGDHCQAKGTGAICLLGGRSCFIWTHALTPAGLRGLLLDRIVPSRDLFLVSSVHHPGTQKSTYKVLAQGSVCRKTGSSFPQWPLAVPICCLLLFAADSAGSGAYKYVRCLPCTPQYQACSSQPPRRELTSYYRC